MSSLEVLQKIGRDRAEAVAMAFMAMKVREEGKRNEKKHKRVCLIYLMIFC